MKPATILRIHSIISSALELAVRYDWADRNVAKNASPPHPRKREPDPPSPDQAARLLNLVWAEDEEFGLYLWTAFTTGARRGEVSDGSALIVKHQRADRNLQNHVLSGVAGAVGAFAVAAAIGLEFAIVAVAQQRVVVWIGFQVDVAAMAAVASGGAAARNIFLAPKGHAAVTAIAGLHEYFGFINEHWNQTP